MRKTTSKFEYKGTFLEPIDWRPREFNTAADHAVNVTLDSGASWESIDEALLDNALRSRSSLRLCVDGGLRRSGLAGAGFALFAYTGEGGDLYQLLGRQGLHLLDVGSAFEAEALALEWALEWLASRMLPFNKFSNDF